MSIRACRIDAYSSSPPIRRTPVPAVAALLLILAAVSCGPKTGPQGGAEGSEERDLKERFAALARKEQLLAAELSLARNPTPYIAVDLKNRRIDLKVQGRSLRSFAISKASSARGISFVAKTWIGIDAKPLQSTARARVVPGSGEATSSSIATRDPWGPRRMPADYDLVCKDQQALEIRSLPSDQSRSRFTRWIIGGYRQAHDWTRDVLLRHRAAYRDSLELWMTEEDARQLFWSLPKQFGILILNPQ